MVIGSEPRKGNRGMQVAIKAISCALPSATLTNEELVADQPDWTAEKLFSKTGIRSRRVACDDETAADLAHRAAKDLLDQHDVAADSIELLVFCTQSPDYLLPTTACILQDRLELPTTCAAFDINLGCSGYVYGLSLVLSFMESNGFSRALLLTGDTYTRYLDASDRSTRSIFGDGASATLLESVSADEKLIGPFVFGTDGSGFDRLIVPGSGVRSGTSDASGDLRHNVLFMAGPSIFTFTLNEVPSALVRLLSKCGRTLSDIDLFVFHQANAFMLENLRRKCGIPAEKFVIDMAETGNTVSTSIPLVLERLQTQGRLVSGQTLALVGFGVGYSWAACVLKWH
jgi:3-oxoacyl-[acyl-carrier-protein] synthase-3